VTTYAVGVKATGPAALLAGDTAGRFAWHVGAPDYRTQWNVRQITTVGPLGRTIASVIAVYLQSPFTQAGLVDGGGPYVSASALYQPSPLVVPPNQDLWLVWDSQGAGFTGTVLYDQAPPQLGVAD
jgi:hypothetical protein